MRVLRNNGDEGNGFDRQFRQKLKNFETTPPSDLWDKVEDGLDEERARVKYDHWYRALVYFLIPLTLINTLVTYELSDYKNYFDNAQLLWEEQYHPFDGSYSPSENSIPLIAHAKFSNRQTPQFNCTDNSLLSVTDASNENIIDEKTDDLLFQNVNQVSTEIHDSESAESVLPDKTIALERILLETSAVADDLVFQRSRSAIEKNITSVKGFHVGFETGLNNSWLLHKDNSLHPLIGNAIHRKFNWGAFYGVSAGYDFSHKFGIEAEWIVRSSQGQRYFENRYNKLPIEGDVDLEYMHVPVMFKYKWTKVGSRSLDPRVMNLVTGIMYSRLLDARVTLNDYQIDDVNRLFNQNELGLLLGFEYDFFVNQNYYLTLGARASISTDVKGFPYYQPKDSETYNVLIGINASFNYLMRK